MDIFGGQAVVAACTVLQDLTPEMAQGIMDPKAATNASRFNNQMASR
jgi:hypothetical protein